MADGMWWYYARKEPVPVDDELNGSRRLVLYPRTKSNQGLDEVKGPDLKTTGEASSRLEIQEGCGACQSSSSQGMRYRLTTSDLGYRSSGCVENEVLQYQTIDCSVIR